MKNKLRLVIAILPFFVACSSNSNVIGDTLDCLGGPTDIMHFFADPDLTSAPFIAVDFWSGEGHIYDEEIKLWHPLPDGPGSLFWRLTPEGSLLVLTREALLRSHDAISWEELGPGGGGSTGALIGSTTDGSHWYFKHFQELLRLAPGTDSWEPAFESDIQHIKAATMAPDHSIWLTSLDDNAMPIGFYRISPDGSDIELVLDCYSQVFSYCQRDPVFVFNERGDLYIWSGGPFYQRDQETGEFVNRGFEPDRETYIGGMQSMAAVGDSLLITVRDEYSGGSGFLFVFEPGSSADSQPRFISELQDRNSVVARARDASAVYTYGGGVCRLE